ncbi:histidine phosphatase family protein [Clostridium saccharoperbutylacetonicum]|jgi:broad specificity phosphatase PhoE
MRIFISRHGDKIRGRYYNESLKHQDGPLTEKGEISAKRLIEFFDHIEIKRIIVSEYLRTCQTAKYIAENKCITVETDSRLNEIDNGIIESMDEEEIIQKYPEFWRDFNSHTMDVRFPEGETGEEVKLRQKSFLDELIQRDEDVFIVSHEGYIRLLICHLLDIPVYKRYMFQVDMCGIMEFEYNKSTEEWKIIRFNYTLDMPY